MLAIVSTALALHSPVLAPRCPAPVAQATAAAFDLRTYMEEKRVYTEAALEASLKSTVPQTCDIAN